ncbi:MAG: glycosyltransferase family 2 protein, partial [Thermoanaerobaculia bacterium]|nr:glycosyltransferase family 2 protein [Thermoanaerobaculia bacterium]
PCLSSHDPILSSVWVSGKTGAIQDVDIVVKIDGDGQMDPRYLPDLIRPLEEGRADYSKGNRFRYLRDLEGMPRARVFGNIGLTFLTKLASGCWHVVDVQNGYLAITRTALAALPLDRTEKGYAFENWMLTQVSINSFRVAEIPMPAVYGDEVSNLSIRRSLLSFPPKLCALLLERIFLRYVIYDLSPIALYLLCAILFLLFGGLFGGYLWWQSLATGLPTPTGSITLALVPILLEFQVLVQAVDLDMRNSPRPREARPERPFGPPRQASPMTDTRAAPKAAHRAVEGEYLYRQLFDSPAPADVLEMYQDAVEVLLPGTLPALRVDVSRLVRRQLDPSAVELFLRLRHRRSNDLRQRIHILLYLAELRPTPIEGTPTETSERWKAWRALSGAALRVPFEFLKGWYQTRRHRLTP